MITDGLGNVTMSAEEYEAFCDTKVERAAVAIFAAMQANPNWNGSIDNQDSAIVAARILIGRLYRRDA